MRRVDPEFQVATHSSRLTAVKKYGASTGEDPFADVKDKTKEGLEQGTADVLVVMRTVDVQVVQYIDTFVNVPVVKRRHEHNIQIVPKTLEVPANLCLDRVVDVLVMMQQQMQMLQKVPRTVEIPQLQIVEQIVEVPEIQMVQDTQTSESFGHGLQNAHHSYSSQHSFWKLLRLLLSTYNSLPL